MNSRITLIIFAVVLLFIICFFTARIYIYGFKLGAHPAKGVVISTIFVAVLYIGGLLDANTGNRLGRKVYTVINILAGIFFYLFLGAILIGLISIGYALSGKDLPIALAWTILGLSLGASIIGFIQAKRITITRYTVTLPNAPASWNGKTAAMISDTHFGLVNYTKFADKVVNKLLALKPDFVLHAGDFYDGPVVDTVPITESWKKLTAQIPLFYTPGNHEAYGDYTMFVDSVRHAGGIVLDNKVTEYDGVQIAGVLYHPGKENPEVSKVLAGLSLDKSKPTILINHPPTAFIAPEEHGVNLIVSGHTHQGQFWPLRYITHKVYGKYDYGMSMYNNMVSITSNGIGTYGPPLRFINSPEIVLITFVATV